MLEHVASWLGLPKPREPALWDRVRATRDLSNLVVHWTGSEQALVDAAALVDSISEGEHMAMDADSLVPRGVTSDPGSLVARLAMSRPITLSGGELDSGLASAITRWTHESEQHEPAI